MLHIQYSKGFVWVIYYNINIFQWLPCNNKGKELYHLFGPKVLAIKITSYYLNSFIMCDDFVLIHFFINPLKYELIFIIFKNSVYRFHKTHCISITKTNWLMLFWEIISLFWYSYKTINTPCRENAEVLNVKANGTYASSNQLCSKGLRTNTLVVCFTHRCGSAIKLSCS